MKILITTNTIESKTGNYVVLKNIIPYLMKNHHITILTNKCDVDIDYNDLVQLKTSKIFPQYFYMSNLKKLFNEEFFNNFDVIHAFEYPLHATDFLTMKKNHIKPPLIISPHGSLTEFNSFPLNYLKKIHNGFMLRYKNNVSKFVACSFAEKNRLIEHGINKNHIEVVILGVNSMKLDFSKRIGKNITYIGRLTKTKHVDLLIKAFAKLRNDDAKLTIAGSDYGTLSSLKDLVKKLKIENRVTFTGWISEEEKKEILSRTSIFVHPSLEDIFSLSLAEASASGVPIVAFDIEENSEIISDMITGKLVKEKNYESLKDTLDFILDDTKLIEQFSENGLKLTTKKFDWKQTALKLEKIYTDSI